MNAIKLYRISRWCWQHHLGFIAKFFRALIFLLYTSYIPYTTEIGAGTKCAYKGIAVVIHARAVIGEKCMIGPCVTIGGKSKHYEVPIIGNHVYIAGGAKVIGSVKVGNNVMIGANAVVTQDVPDNCIVAGVPAKVIKSDINIYDYWE
jgi:serine O-acetyltransferase